MKCAVININEGQRDSTEVKVIALCKINHVLIPGT